MIKELELKNKKCIPFSYLSEILWPWMSYF